MPALLVLLAAGAAAAAVYEFWLKPAGSGPMLPAGASGALGPPARVNLTPPAVAAAVPGARLWVQSIAHTGFDLSPAGDSLVNAILLILRTFGTRAVPGAWQQLAKYGVATGTDWTISGAPQTTHPGR